MGHYVSFPDNTVTQSMSMETIFQHSTNPDFSKENTLLTIKNFKEAYIFCWTKESWVV